MSYEGPERRSENRLILDELKDRLLRLELAMRALENRIEDVHKRNKERDDQQMSHVTKLNDAYFGNGRKGLISRIEHVEYEFETISKEMAKSIVSIRSFQNVLKWVVGIVCSIQIAQLGVLTRLLLNAAN